MCDVTVVATPASLPVARAAVRRWLVELGWPPEKIGDIVLAVHEAVTNAVEHAYPRGVAGLVEVTGVVESGSDPTDPDRNGCGGARRVRLWVGDHGRWRPDMHDRSDIARDRGRGLDVMTALMAEMTITSSAGTGTTVVLLSESVPNRHCDTAC